MVKFTTKIEVQTGATRIVPHNARRSALSLVNTDPDNDVFIEGDRSVSPTQGFKIRKGGGVLNLNRGLGDTPELELFGAADPGTAILDVFEQYTTPRLNVGEKQNNEPV